MSILSIHSFRRGTGKTTIAANTAAMLALQGYRVGIIDLNFAAPGLHILFNLPDDLLKYTLNEFVWGECDIEDAVYDLAPFLPPTMPGQIFFVPASTQPRQIARILRGGYYVNLLGEACAVLKDKLQLDFLLLDTASGLIEDTQMALAITDTLWVILRLDQQDYMGTGIIIDVARRLNIQELKLIVNEVPISYAEQTVRQEVEQAYGCEVTAVLPHTEQLTLMGSSGLFVLAHPKHSFVTRFRHMTSALGR